MEEKRRILRNCEWSIVDLCVTQSVMFASVHKHKTIFLMWPRSMLFSHCTTVLNSLLLTVCLLCHWIRGSWRLRREWGVGGVWPSGDLWLWEASWVSCSRVFLVAHNWITPCCDEAWSSSLCSCYIYSHLCSCSCFRCELTFSTRSLRLKLVFNLPLLNHSVRGSVDTGIEIGWYLWHSILTTTGVDEGGAPGLGVYVAIQRELSQNALCPNQVHTKCNIRKNWANRDKD
jgi:hypothetical protein